MASNLNTARSLIEADLEHARNVMDLWSHQVMELEKALAQIIAVGESRDALRVQYQGAGNRAPALEATAAAAADSKPKRGRKPGKTDAGNSVRSGAAGKDLPGKRGRKLADRSGAAPGQVSEARTGPARKSAATKSGRAKPAAKYKDPNSDKTWSGRGRRPAWFSGQPEQYAIRPQDRASGNEAQNPDAAAQGGGMSAAG